MRVPSHPQLWFAPVPDSPEQREYEKMSKVLDTYPELLSLVHADLTEGVDPAKGRNGMTAEQTLRAMVLRAKNQFTYEELRFHLNDSSTYRWFCRLEPGKTVSESTLNRTIKRIRPETLEQINRAVMQYAAEAGIEKGRKVRTDCTVVESNIHKPTDSSLLWDVIRVLSGLLVTLGSAVPGVHARNHTRLAKRRVLRIENARSKKQRYKPYCDLISAAKKTLGYAKNALQLVQDNASPQVVGLAAQLEHFIPLGEKVIDQARRRIIDGESVPVSEKVVSIFEPHTDIIVKDKRETLYGHKICLTAGKSGLILDCQILDGNPADSTLAVEMAKRVGELYERPPLQVTFDGSFSSLKNLQEIKEIGVRDVAFSKARGIEVEDMAKSTWVYKKLRKFRAGVEGIISFVKRSFGLARCTWRGESSFKSYVWSSILSANLVTLARALP